MNNIIQGCITGVITIILGIYVSFTLREKGVILSNTYMYASKKEREKIDKKAEYKLVSIIFGNLTISLSFLTIYLFTLWEWTYVLFWVFIVIVLIYGIVDTIKKAIKQTK